MKKLHSTIAVAALISLCGTSAYAKSPKAEPDKNEANIPYEILKTTEAGVEVRKGGFGSDACAYPGDSSKFYLVNTICVANDNDFALIEKDNKLCQKILPGTTNPEDDVVYSIKVGGK